jgi:hypothetical protein
METIQSAQSEAELFLDFSRKKLLEQYWPRLQRVVESLTDVQILVEAEPG